MGLSLLILAAGMGSRYGGLKQLDQMGPSGETVMDYSVFDAINKDAEVICFYYSEDTKVEMETTLKSLGFRYVMVQNAEIFR